MWGLAEHGGADDRGALSEASLGVARAGGGISGGGRTELPAPDSGIFCSCGWVEEGSAVPPSKSEAPGDGVSSSGFETGSGPAVSGDG